MPNDKPLYRVLVGFNYPIGANQERRVEASTDEKDVIVDDLPSQHVEQLIAGGVIEPFEPVPAEPEISAPEPAPATSHDVEEGQE